MTMSQYSTTLFDAINLLLLRGIRLGILLIDVDEPSMDSSYNEATLKSQENALRIAAQHALPILDIILHGQRTIDRLRCIIDRSINYIPYRKNMESAFDEGNINLLINVWHWSNIYDPSTVITSSLWATLTTTVFLKQLSMLLTLGSMYMWIGHLILAWILIWNHRGIQSVITPGFTCIQPLGSHWKNVISGHTGYTT